MATVVHGPRVVSGSRDAEGYRTYRVTWVVEGVRGSDSVANVMATAGLPAVGSTWALFDEEDVWVWCTPEMDVQEHPDKREGAKDQFYLVEQVFTNKPVDPSKQRCNDTQIEDPLLEPPKIEVDGIDYQEEASYDRFGKPITTSSHELIRGPQNEWPHSQPTVHIEMNVPDLDLALVTSLANFVNSEPLWGLPPRCIKLRKPKVQRKFFGQCFKYYTLILDFDCRRETWDRDILDQGKKCLKGHWEEGGWVIDDIDGEPADPNDPSHFMRAVDRENNPIDVILNGAGVPAVKLADVTEFWWWIDDLQGGYDFFGTCTDALAESQTGSALALYGPYDDPPDPDTPIDKPQVTACETITYLPGNRHVEKFHQADFLTLLGVPASLTD